MTNDQLKSLLTEKISGASFEEGPQFLQVTIPSAACNEVADVLRHYNELQFDFLFCLTCVDWKTKLTLVYHLRSTVHRHELVVKCDLDRGNPRVETVSHIWRTAEFHEREVYEMFGVHFINHPDLRLLILPDGWENRNPLRKDFEDPVNMIKL